MQRHPSRYLIARLALAGLLAASAACSEQAQSAPAESSAAVVQLAPENVTRAVVGRISSGPTISGQLTPAREAKVRAQVGGSVVELPFDRGQSVRAGATIARISSRDLESAVASAKAAVKSAETALSVATSELQRTEALVKGGAVAARDLEQARNAASSAEAQLAAARARERSAEQQLEDTVLKAPFSGVISDRPASLGDVVAPGTEILTIIDPSSMRLDAQVPSDQIASVKPGAIVHFSLRGVTGDFDGRVERVSPAADPVTRQVPVYVTVPNSGGRLIAGLFAEGRIETSSKEGVVVPLAAVDETGATPFVTRLTGGKAERVPVTLGPRQGTTERVEVTSGVSDGDVLVVGSAKGIAPGTPVKVIG
jgi:RND family efflux transporter MFP subunit